MHGVWTVLNVLGLLILFQPMLLHIPNYRNGFGSMHYSSVILSYLDIILSFITILFIQCVDKPINFII